MHLSEDFAKWLGGVSIAQAAGLATIVVKFYFDKDEGDKYTVAPTKPGPPAPGA